MRIVTALLVCLSVVACPGAQVKEGGVASGKIDVVLRRIDVVKASWNSMDLKIIVAVEMALAATSTSAPTPTSPWSAPPPRNPPKATKQTPVPLSPTPPPVSTANAIKEPDEAPPSPTRSANCRSL